MAPTQALIGALPDSLSMYGLLMVPINNSHGWRPPLVRSQTLYSIHVPLYDAAVLALWVPSYLPAHEASNLSMGSQQAGGSASSCHVLLRSGASPAHYIHGNVSEGPMLFLVPCIWFLCSDNGKVYLDYSCLYCKCESRNVLLSPVCPYSWVMDCFITRYYAGSGSCRKTAS